MEEISTGRLRIVPFSERHLTAEYVSWLNDKEHMRYSEQRHRTHTIDTCRAYLESFRDTPHHFWAIETTAEPVLHIGNLNAYVDERNLVADVGILIGHPTARGRGYGLEAWSAALDYLLHERGMRKVTAGAMATNAAMLAIMRRSGMVEDGVRRRQLLREGAEIDVVHMARFAEST